MTSAAERTAAHDVTGGPPTGSEALRIAVVAPPFFAIPPTGYGGIERVVDVLVNGLVARGHDVTLFAAPGTVSVARVETPLAVAPRLGDPSSVMDELSHSMAPFLGDRQFDLVHDHTVAGPVLGAVREGHPPVIHTLHGPWTEVNRRFYVLVHDRVDLVTISRAQRAGNPALRYAGVVYNGIDVAMHPFNAAKGDYLVFVGRISPEKRPEWAIEVARRAGLPLVMIVKRNEPAEVAYWQEVVAPRLGTDVEVLEQPPHQMKAAIVGGARALVFPIDWPEPFGLVMTESMASGTPVIARPLGAVPEVVVDGVTGFVRTTVDEMAEAVDQARWLSPAACRAHVVQRFSAEAMVAGYESVYRRALSRQARQRPGLLAAAS